MFDAVVLAGGGTGGPLTEQEGVSNKAFIKIHGRPMLGYILQALAESELIEKIYVVGPQEELAELLEEGYRFIPVPEAGSLLENAGAGLKQVDPQRLCLMLTADIPLINKEAIEGFLKICAPYDDDFYYPILTRECCRERFPMMKRTYVRLRDGCFTGGNIALLRPVCFNQAYPRLHLFVAYRKKPLKLFRIMPTSFIFKFLLNLLTVADLESYLSRMLQVRGRAVPCNFVEIGTDVDKISDLEVVRQALKKY